MSEAIPFGPSLRLFGETGDVNVTEMKPLIQVLNIKKKSLILIASPKDEARNRIRRKKTYVT